MAERYRAAGRHDAGADSARRLSRRPFRDPRCIWTTRFEKMVTRNFLVLHEAIVSGQSILSCAGCAGCLR